MSGLCGWMGHGANAGENRVLIEAMAAPLSAFDASSVATLQGARGAVAVAALAASSHVYQNDGLLVAIWGQPTVAGSGANMAEALAGAWRRDPDAVCAQLSGAFSLCILDDNKGEALLAIDRVGTQQMIYQVKGGAIVFGSSSDAIVRHPLTPGAIDHQGLYNYVYFHMVPAPGTAYLGQERLLPGEYLRFRNGAAAKKTYWRMVFDEQPEVAYETRKEQFLALLRSSVKEAGGGQQVGAFLSGGTDSSTIAGILTETGGRPADTYSIGFEAEGYDEMSYARLASRHFGTSHHEYYVTPDDVVSAIPKVPDDTVIHRPMRGLPPGAGHPVAAEVQALVF